MLISQLTDIQRQNLAWRLDSKTSCGMLTACRVARLELGDMEVDKVFVNYGDCSPHSAKCHAALVKNFPQKWKKRSKMAPG